MVSFILDSDSMFAGSALRDDNDSIIKFTIAISLIIAAFNIYFFVIVRYGNVILTGKVFSANLNLGADCTFFGVQLNHTGNYREFLLG
ncbi:hypothetical protein ES708_13046 [subsurface metagenome]